jgi:ketosteroid isomerase-like protein
VYRQVTPSMRPTRRRLGLLATLVLLPAGLAAQRVSSRDTSALGAFNNALANATRRMDNAATLALWDDDGVSLLPSTKPIVGKTAIGDFLRRTTASFTGAHMQQFDLRCHDVEVSGDWASEWCTEHQIVILGGGRPPFDGWGKLLFVLHRGPDGRWRIRTEMWNQAVPDSAASR